MEGTLNAKDGSILVFIDETGHEEFADSKFPVFGLGGCLFATIDGPKIIDEPWLNLKGKHFPDFAGRPFHAAEICDVSDAQAEALGSFFRSTPFRRFACVIRSSAENQDSLRIIQVVVPAVMNQVCRLLRGLPLTAVHIIWEDSQRLNTELGFAFAQLLFKSANGTRIPVTYHILPKASSEPGLEIADCVIHTAGCQVRNNMSGKQRPRRDFQAIFQSRSKTESEFVEITGFKIEST